MLYPNKACFALFHQMPKHSQQALQSFAYAPKCMETVAFLHVSCQQAAQRLLAARGQSELFHGMPQKLKHAFHVHAQSASGRLWPEVAVP